MVFAAECLRLTFTCCSPNDCSEIHLHVFILQRLQAGGRKLPRHTKKQQRYGRHRAQQQFLPFHTKHVTEVLFCDIPLRDFTRYQHPDGTEGGGGGLLAHTRLFLSPLSEVLPQPPLHSAPTCPLQSRQTKLHHLGVASVRKCILLHLS